MPLLAVTCLAACATSESAAPITSQATGSSYFRLGAPGVYKAGDGLLLAGRVCRLGRTTLLSPPRVRLEHVSVNGEPLQATHASVAAIYESADQACSNYSARVSWRFAEGEAVRACFDRGRACPADAQVKTVTAAPVPPATPR